MSRMSEMHFALTELTAQLDDGEIDFDDAIGSLIEQFALDPVAAEKFLCDVLEK